jgi:hypothetical protein
MDTSRNPPDWVSSGANRTTRTSEGNWTARSFKVLGRKVLALALPYQLGSDGSTPRLLTLSIVASQSRTGAGGMSPNPADLRYASSCPARVIADPPPTGVPVIDPLTTSAVTDARRVVQTSSTTLGGTQKLGSGSPCAGAMFRTAGIARTNMAAPTAAVVRLRQPSPSMRTRGGTRWGR